MTGRVLRSGLPGLIALLIGIALFEFVQPLAIASFGGAQGLDAIMERIPPALQSFTRTRPEFLALSGLAGYLSLGFTHPRSEEHTSELQSRQYPLCFLLLEKQHH